MQTINERFSYAIELIGQKKTDVAKTVGVSDAAISKICSGKTNPSAQTIKSFCDNFCIDRVWLETGEGDPRRQQSRSDQLAAALGRVLHRQDSASARLIGSIALVLEKLDDDQIAAVLKAMADIIQSYNSE